MEDKIYQWIKEVFENRKLEDTEIILNIIRNVDAETMVKYLASAYCDRVESIEHLIDRRYRLRNKILEVANANQFEITKAKILDFIYNDY